jgi:hypothetical protein
MVNIPPSGTDPTVPSAASINDTAQATQNLTTNTIAQTAAYHDLNTVSDLVQTGMDGIEQAAKDAGVSLGSLTDLTQEQSEKFAVFTSAAVNARIAFAGFSNVDYSGLSTFTDQIKVLREALENTPLTQTVAAVKMLAQGLVGAGASQSSVNTALAKGKDAVLALATNMATHADNMARAQTAYVQMAARTGELGDVMTKAGAGLKDMNALLEKQQMMLQYTREATGLTAKQTEEWYSQLGSIPGALKETVSLGDKAGASTSMLTATIQAATGSGRSMADVMKDLSTAFRDYGLVGEKALLFSVRMSDVSTRLKAPIEDVSSALRGSADAFKMFATGQENAASSAESLAKTLNTYGKALESTGLSATAAVEVAGQLNTQVAKLNTGQLAFISQQTGGAGGLQGAAQETLKLQKDPGAVVEDAMKTLQQQFGKIVTVQEAATSQAAASQNIKQTTMLQTLLGPLAKDQASANRLLEAMKNKAEGNPKAIADALSEHPIQDATQKGAEMQAKTYGVTTKIMNLVEQIRDMGDRGSSNLAGKMTAGATSQTLTTAEGAFKDSLKRQMAISSAAGGEQVKKANEGTSGGLVKDTSNRDAAANIQQALSSLKDIPTFLRASFDTLTGAFRSGDKEGVSAEENLLKEMIESRKLTVKQLEGSPGQAQAMSELKAAQTLLNAAESVSSPSGKRVGTAAQHAVAYSAPGAAHTPGTGSASAHVPYSAPGSANALHIIGKITIDCPHCGKAHDASSQFKAYTGPAGQSQQ